jgi:hydrogenase nickel incorporation protein HypA/HybF
MHEHSVMNQLIRQIIHQASIAKARTVTSISVKLGALSHMSLPHFREHFEIAAKGTIAEHAKIVAEESQDIHDPHAAMIILQSIDVEN